MRSRHWEMLSERTQIKVMAKANLTFSRCLELGLHNFVDDIATVAEIAGKEFTIEQVYSFFSFVHTNKDVKMLPADKMNVFSLIEQVPQGRRLTAPVIYYCQITWPVF